jgi:NADPH2 dehydrogenase
MLFEKISLRDLTLKNRIVLAPMCMYSAAEDARVTEWHRIHYGTRALGGAGLVMTEATAVSPEGRISPSDLGLYDDAHACGMRGLVDLIHSFGAAAGVQLAHAGRKCTANVPAIYAPSALAYDDDSPVPIAADAPYIEKIVADFASAAARAAEAGFDLIQIHGAHGYLLNEFLSPLTNLREDEYGGSYENRARLPGRVIAAVRAVWPEQKPLSLRVSAEDYEEDGNRPEDVAAMINLVKDRGVDAINVSSGGVTPTAPKAFNGYQVPMAEVIKLETGLPVCAGGLITDANYADEIISSGRCDLVYVGRELLRNPFFPLLAAPALGAEVEWPESYERAKPRG